ncbi:MAG: hypothetical protein J7K96_06005 [Desulfobacteraceae bacterium]|nr:hypothetical protein [Desulfobacteraceae bacterium]
MKKVKLAFWLILFGFLGLVFWGSYPFLLEKKGLVIKYFINKSYSLPELQIALYFLIFFLVGLLISYFSSLSERFVARKMIRQLNDELTTVGKKVTDLEASLESRQAADSTAGRIVTSGSASVPEL